jgi:hypothetical protein
MIRELAALDIKRWLSARTGVANTVIKRNVGSPTMKVTVEEPLGAFEPTLAIRTGPVSAIRMGYWVITIRICYCSSNECSHFEILLLSFEAEF